MSQESKTLNGGKLLRLVKVSLFRVQPVNGIASEAVLGKRKRAFSVPTTFWLKLLATVLTLCALAVPGTLQAQFHGFTIVKSDNPGNVRVGDRVTTIGKIENADDLGDSIIITN